LRTSCSFEAIFLVVAFLPALTIAETAPALSPKTTASSRTYNRPMKKFTRELIHKHAVGPEWPEFLGQIALGESFVAETERFNFANGPFKIDGVKAGEDIAVHIEMIEIVGPFLSPNGGPFYEGMGDPVPIEYRDGIFYYPKGFTLAAKPSVGNVAVLPKPTDAIRRLIRESGRDMGWRAAVNHPRGKHCHQDCRFLGEGAIIHLKA